MARVWRLAATASLVVGLAAAGVVAHVLSDESSKPIRHSASGIALDRPDGWQIQSFGGTACGLVPGLLVSNVAGHGFRNVETPSHCTNQSDLSGLPRSFVLLDASFLAHPFPPSGEASTPVPLLLSRFRRQASADYGGCGSCARSSFGVVKGRHTYLIQVWVGSEASADDKHKLEQLVRTLRFDGPNGG